MNGLTPEMDAELDELIEMSKEVAQAMQSPWQPSCISAAFKIAREPFVFTMQVWIELDAIRSPLLNGGLPETVEQLAAAATAFGHSGQVELTPEEGAELAFSMRDAVSRGHSTSLEMRRPNAEESHTESGGFGAWMPLFACLVVQCGLSMAEARAVPVAQAFALIAAMRFNQAWEPAGTEYALRDLEDSKQPVAGSENETDVHGGEVS